ncbi:MAG: xylulokinase [Promethearchaeota archaeon]
MSNENDQFILAFDHGTSGMKTAIVSIKGELQGFAYQNYGLYHFEQGCAEQDPQDWWDALVNTSKKVIEDTKIHPSKIIAIVSSNQMDGTVPVDKNGHPLHNCITWLDSRGSKIIKEKFGGIIGGYNLRTIINWILRTGGAPSLSGKDIIGHILWLKKHFSEIYENTWKFMDCKDYLNFRLTGKVYTSHDCGILTWLVNSSDINNIHYDDKLLRLAGLEKHKLPELKTSTFNLGPILPSIAQELGLDPSTQVILGAGDMASAAIGSGAVLPGQGHICLGTSSWIITHTIRRKLDIDHYIGSIPSAIPNMYMIVGEQEAAGINLNWIKDNVLYHKDKLLKEEQKLDVYKIFDELVSEIPPGAHNMIFTPWLFGERAPVEDHTLRGGLFNISLDTDRRHILRAIFEGVAFNSRWLLQSEEKLVGKPFEEISLMGGGSTSDVWCQIYADVLNRTIKQAKHGQESNSIGAALIASIALGKISWDDIPLLISYKAVYTPQKENRKIYDTLFKEFVNIYTSNKKMYQRLNRFH